MSLAVDASTTNGACSLTGDTVNYLHVGSCVLDATVGASTDYQAAGPVQQTIAVGQASQTITFTAPSVGAVGGVVAVGTVVVVGADGEPRGDASTTNGACSLTGDTVNYLHVGSCVVDATVGASTDYQAAGPVQQTIAVGQGTQTVKFTTTAPLSGTAAGPTYTPAANATSGLPVTIALDPTSSGCSLSGGVVSFTGPGSCVIDAGQSGNADIGGADGQADDPGDRVRRSDRGVGAGADAGGRAGLAGVQGRNAKEKATIIAAVNAVTSVLGPVGPSVDPAQNALRIDAYDAGLVALRLTGMLTSAQVTMLEHEAAQL